MLNNLPAMSPRKWFYILVACLGTLTLVYMWAEPIAVSNGNPLATNGDQPIQLAYFYKPAQAQTMTELAPLLHTLILTRNDEIAVQEAKAAGFPNPILQYLRMDAMQGPDGLTNDQAGPCTDTQRNFEPYNNHIANEIGEFCAVHDSIVTGQAFDHDLNVQTSPIVATEDWFLHNSSLQRLGEYDGGGFYYQLNLGNQHVREYFAARMIRELEGTFGHPPTGMDGIFLDNLELSWEKKLFRLDISGQPIEYASSEAWVAAVRGAVVYYSQTIRSRGYPLWANMIESPLNGLDWNTFAPYLDGAMEESFALDWRGDPVSPSILETELEQATSWMAQGKYYLAVSQGDDNQDQARYGLANMLLVTDGAYGIFRHADHNNYSEFLQYPEYEYDLGHPLGTRYQVESSDVIWARDFECGYVEVNATQGTGTIETFPCPAD